MLVLLYGRKHGTAPATQTSELVGIESLICANSSDLFLINRLQEQIFPPTSFNLLVERYFHWFSRTSLGLQYLIPLSPQSLLHLIAVNLSICRKKYIFPQTTNYSRGRKNSKRSFRHHQRHLFFSLSFIHINNNTQCNNKLTPILQIDLNPDLLSTRTNLTT